MLHENPCPSTLVRRSVLQNRDIIALDRWPGRRSAKLGSLVRGRFTSRELLWAAMQYSILSYVQVLFKPHSRVGVRNSDHAALPL